MTRALVIAKFVKRHWRYSQPTHTRARNTTTPSPLGSHSMNPPSICDAPTYQAITAAIAAPPDWAKYHQCG